MLMAANVWLETCAGLPQQRVTASHAEAMLHRNAKQCSWPMVANDEINEPYLSHSDGSTLWCRFAIRCKERCISRVYAQLPSACVLGRLLRNIRVLLPFDHYDLHSENT